MRWLKAEWMSMQRRLREDWLHRYPFVFVATLAVIGIVIDATWYRSFQLSFISWTVLASFALATSVSFDWQSKRRTFPRASTCKWIVNAVLVVCFFGLYHALCEMQFRGESISNWVDVESKPVVVRGRLARTVSLRHDPLPSREHDSVRLNWRSQLIVDLDAIRREETFEAIAGRLLVYVDGDLSHLRPGDAVEIYGWLKPFDAPTNPGEPDLRPAFRRRGLHARLETNNAGAVRQLTESDQPIDALIATIATRGREALFRHTDERTGPLAVALVIGQRQFVDTETRDALLATGTAHLLSVSGMHLAIIVLATTWALSGLGLRPFSKFFIIVAISAIYVAVTGGRPPVLRAAILVSMLLLSMCFRRPSQPLNTLAVAALVLIVINPLNVFSIGVHLSFLAVMTLMLSGGRIASGAIETELRMQPDGALDRLIESASSRWMIWFKSLGRFFLQMAWLSGCVTAISLPLVWSQFHCVSLVSVATNVMVWAGLMVALPTGVLTVILDPISTSIAAAPGTACHLALLSMWKIIRWTESWPGGHAWLPSPPTWWVVGFYLVIGVTMLIRGTRIRWFRRGWVFLWSVVAFWMATTPAARPDHTLEATFVDVGHGSSIVLRLPDGRVCLYDCGRMGNADGNSRRIDSVLWSLGVTRLDAVVLSHADADHYNALPGLLRRFRVDQIVTPVGMLATDEYGLEPIRRAIRRHSVPVVELSAGDELLSKSSAASLELEVLHPPVGGLSGSDNANSLVLRIDHGGTTFLLPGDLEPPGTDRLLRAERPPPRGVMMAPHHGSLSADAKAILSWARPSEVVVSGGKLAERPQVSSRLEATGGNVSITSLSGAIRVRLDSSGKIEVRGWKSSPW
jgi:competence protein ComEC